MQKNPKIDRYNALLSLIYPVIKKELNDFGVDIHFDPFKPRKKGAKLELGAAPPLFYNSEECKRIHHEYQLETKFDPDTSFNNHTLIGLYHGYPLSDVQAYIDQINGNKISRKIKSVGNSYFGINCRTPEGDDDFLSIYYLLVGSGRDTPARDHFFTTYCDLKNALLQPSLYSRILTRIRITLIDLFNWL